MRPVSLFLVAARFDTVWADERRQTSRPFIELAAVFDETSLSVTTEANLLEESMCVAASRRTKKHHLRTVPRLTKSLDFA